MENTIETNYEKIRKMFGMTCWEIPVGRREVATTTIEAVHSVRGIVMIQKFHDKEDGLTGFQVYLPASTDNSVDSEEKAISEFLSVAL
jgi:hypothetical protein